MTKLECDFLHCDAEAPMIIVRRVLDKDWGLCWLHDRIIEANGATIEYEGGREHLFSSVMFRGKPD